MRDEVRAHDAHARKLLPQFFHPARRDPRPGDDQSLQGAAIHPVDEIGEPRVGDAGVVEVQ